MNEEINHILVYDKVEKKGVDIDYIEKDGETKVLAVDRLYEGDLNV